LLNIDNKISPLPIGRCIKKPFCYCTFTTQQQIISDFGKILRYNVNLLAIKLLKFS